MMINLTFSQALFTLGRAVAAAEGGEGSLDGVREALEQFVPHYEALRQLMREIAEACDEADGGWMERDEAGYYDLEKEEFHSRMCMQAAKELLSLEED
jgi:hypothetical protein